MFKQASFNRSVVSANALAESALFASRQAWLAGLGAVSISREWARHEAGNTFRALVRKGSVVEKNAIQVIGGRVERGRCRELVGDLRVDKAGGDVVGERRSEKLTRFEPLHEAWPMMTRLHASGPGSLHE